MSDVRGLKECFQEEGRDVIPEDGKENPCSNLGVSKSEHGYNLSESFTLINQVSNAGYVPKIAVIPTP